MNPVVFNCVLLYALVVLLSVIQSRFRIVKDNPVTFFILLILVPILLLGKAAKLETYTSITGFEIWGWTLVLAYLNPKRIVPRINEGYIYAYTLFHWYLLIDTIRTEGLTWIITIVLLISVYPTFLILKASLENRKLEYKHKMILYYWFLFAIFFTYIDQVALDIIQPIAALSEINVMTTLYITTTAVQLYFIATTFSLLFIGIPIFHLDRSGDSFNQRWIKAKREWRNIVNIKLANYIEYQISFIQFLYISVISAVLFFIDATTDFRIYLILIYTLVFPGVFFYIKWTPEENLDEIEDKA